MRYLSANILLRVVIIVIATFAVVDDSHAQGQIDISRKNGSVSLSQASGYYIDKTDVLTPLEVKTKTFTASNGKIPVFTSNVNNVWLKFAVNNQIKKSPPLLEVQYTNLSSIILYEVVSNDSIRKLQVQGNLHSYRNVFPYSPNYYFLLPVPFRQSKTFLVNVKSEHPIMLPASVSTYPAVQRGAMIQTLIIGFYFGVLMIMFMYNAFLYLSTYDKNYLLYIAYLFCLALAQLAASGYGYKFLWKGWPELNLMAVPLTTALSAVTGIFFTIQFLDTKTNFPKGHKLLLACAALYGVGIIVAPFTRLHILYDIVNFNSLVAVITIVVLCILLLKKGYRPAKLYLVGWSFMLASLLAVIFRNISIIPYNDFTAYILYIGSMIEVALLSFALADKINTYKKEKELSQQQALLALQENERLVREQNVVLERKVNERTEELSVALQDLKDAQTQLVESEKMASLGQLTAGIAHEINNPINFVKSNVKPIRLDVKDLFEVIDEYGKLHQVEDGNINEKLKQLERLRRDIDVDYLRKEVENLLNGIEDGANRTAEIVRGLRTFSRLDESEIKTVDIHEGIDSTLVILKSSIPPHIEVVKEYQANGLIECFPGKLNQVFMNIISNAVHAINAKGTILPENIIIKTLNIDEAFVQVCIKDSGTGMKPEVKQKIFDPFFTTKEVGEGTGLGLAIVFKIVQKHEGRIAVESTEGKGSEFIITLPRRLSNY